VISGSFLEEKTLCSATRFGVKRFQSPQWVVSGFNQQHTVVYKMILDECRNVDSSTVEVWRKEQLLKTIEVYRPKNV
jgi:hypothetical protein